MDYLKMPQNIEEVKVIKIFIKRGVLLSATLLRTSMRDYVTFNDVFTFFIKKLLVVCLRDTQFKKILSLTSSMILQARKREKLIQFLTFRSRYLRRTLNYT